MRLEQVPENTSITASISAELVSSKVVALELAVNSYHTSLFAIPSQPTKDSDAICNVPCSGVHDAVWSMLMASIHSSFEGGFKVE